MSQTRVLISPKPRALLPQQPTLGANLQGTTLAPAVAAPFKPWLAPMPVRRPATQTIEYRNLQANTLAPVIVVNPFTMQPATLPVVRARVQVVEYPNLNANTLAQQIYFLNDTGYTPDVRKAQRPLPFQNLNMTTLATPAAVPLRPAYLPVAATPGKAATQPQLQSGLIQSLTFVAQAPLNQRYWLMPVRGLLRPQPQIAPNLGVLSAPDVTPDQFTFTDQIGVDRNTAIYSNTITLTGFNATIAISVTGAQYSLNGADYTDAAGTASVNDTITLQVISSNTYATAVTGTFTAGGISDDFTVTTDISPTPQRRRVPVTYKRRVAFASGRRRIH